MHRPENLKKLANYLLTLPEDYAHFTMKYYHVKNGRALYINEVGPIDRPNTAACAVGHGFLAGIPIGNAKSWEDYISNFCSNSKEYIWLFAADWERIDNTPTGVSSRIFYMLDAGAPDITVRFLKPHGSFYAKVRQSK